VVGDLVGYLRNRILTYIVVWFVALNLAFILPRLAPGNAAEILAGPGRLPSLAVAQLEARFGLLAPLSTQYLDYLRNTILTFPPNFGFSYEFYPLSVTSLFFQRLPVSTLLMVTSLFLAFAISYLLSMRTSMRRKGPVALASLYGSIAFYSTPVFWASMILLWIFAVDLKLFPVYGSVGNGITDPVAYVLSTLWHLVLPVTAMTMIMFSQLYLLMRGSVQHVLKSDFVTAAKSRGLKDGIIARRYVLRNSLLPVVSLLSFALGILVSMSVLIETVFGFAGVGDSFVDAIFTRDYPVLQGDLFYLTTFVIIGGLIGDLILRRLDPRLD
jgi:peptide/nickel transport system permease protein